MQLGFMCLGRKAAVGRLLILTVALLFCLMGAARAQDISVIGSLPFGATYISDHWVPVRVEVRNDSDREIVGTVRVVPIAEGTPEFRANVKSPPRSRVRKTIWGYFPASKETRLAWVTLNDKSGAQLARVEMTGASFHDEANYLPNGIYEHGFFISITGSDPDLSEYQLLDSVSAILKNANEINASQAQLDVIGAMPTWVPYTSAYMVSLAGMDFDEISPEARAALLDYVRAGGVLLISAPKHEQISGSWIEPLLPVRVIGNREANQVIGPDGKPLQFAQYLPCAEAIAGEGKVLLKDEQFVHAAYRSYGLGRVVFTSFPPGALPEEDNRSAEVWYELIGFSRSPVGYRGTEAQQKYPELMEPMLGRQAASWSLAASAVGVLVLLVIVSHLIWRGANRPTAFKVTLGATVLIAAIFSLLAALRQEAEPLQEARLTIVDASPEGSYAHEFSAVSGSQQMVTRQVQEASIAMRTALVRQERPLLSQWPATLERINVNPQRVDLVGLATAVDRSKTASATGRFGPRGLELTVNNGIGTTLSSAQLSWGLYRLSMPALGQGETQAVLNSANVRPVDEYTAASGLATQDEQHKGMILRSLLSSTMATKSRDLWPAVYAWANEWPGITQLADVQPDRQGAQTLVRIPLVIEPSEGRVRIDGVFNTLYLGEARGLPYDTIRREFLVTSLPGDWVVAVQYPSEVGLLKPSRVKLSMSLEMPQHRLQIRRGQCTGGKAPTSRGNPSGDMIADWDRPVGMHTVEFECTPEDFDQQGRVWLRLSVQPSGSGGSMGVEPQWRFGQVLVDLEGDVTRGSTQP